MNTLWIDLWDKRVGVAIAREGLAFPTDIIPRVELIWYLKKIILDETIQRIIVGLPYDLYGKDTKQLDKTQKFIDKLRDIFPDIDILGHDERFSSFIADGGDSSSHRDDLAAQHILQSFLDTKS